MPGDCDCNEGRDNRCHDKCDNSKIVFNDKAFFKKDAKFCKDVKVGDKLDVKCLVADNFPSGAFAVEDIEFYEDKVVGFQLKRVRGEGYVVDKAHVHQTDVYGELDCLFSLQRCTVAVKFSFSFWVEFKDKLCYDQTVLVGEEKPECKLINYGSFILEKDLYVSEYCNNKKFKLSGDLIVLAKDHYEANNGLKHWLHHLKFSYQTSSSPSECH